MRFFIFLLILFSCIADAQVQIDTSMDLSFVQREFSNTHKILIDGAHNNLHKVNTGFKPLSILLNKMGFDVHGNTNTFQHLETFDQNTLLIIANPIANANRGRPFNPIHSAFTSEEITNVQRWVFNGGKLLLIADHMPFAGAVSELAIAFDIVYENGFVDGESERWPPRTFYAANQTLNNSHFLFEGLDSVSSFTGSAILLPPKAISLLQFNRSDTIIYPDTAWSFAPGLIRKSLEKYSQGGILKYGEGRIAVFGEAAMFTAQTINPQRVKAGFNSEYAPQNVRFIQAVLRWIFQDE